MKSEILKAIEAAKVIEEQKAKLVVGTGRPRLPKDSEGNIVGSPIMIHFDAGRGLVFFRLSDEEGDPWGFEVSLPVAEALGLALNDLLGLFDAVESEKLASLEADLASTAGAANYFAGEKESLEKRLELKSAECSFLQTQIAANQEQIDELLRLRLRIADFEHFAASVSGLYATDRPEKIANVNVGEDIFFKIDPPEAEK